MAILIPTSGPLDWQKLLGDPDKHWKPGRSAMAVAHSWEAAPGLPPEVAALLGDDAELLLAIPEHKVALPGRGADSQCDVFALVRAGGETIAVAVEGKVDEAFGPTVGEWLTDASEGKRQRLASISTLLGTSRPIPETLRYQLFHRSAAAILEARRFGCPRAAMIVQSFSPIDACFADYEQFAAFLGLSAAAEAAATLALPDGTRFTLGWARGDQRFLFGAHQPRPAGV
jgi:hypothetical protein